MSLPKPFVDVDVSPRELGNPPVAPSRRSETPPPPPDDDPVLVGCCWPVLAPPPNMPDATDTSNEEKRRGRRHDERVILEMSNEDHTNNDYVAGVNLDGAYGEIEKCGRNVMIPLPFWLAL